MCMTCGCGTDTAGVATARIGSDGHTHTHADGTTHSHAHVHDHEHDHHHEHDHAHAHAHPPAPGHTHAHPSDHRHAPGPLHYGHGPAGNSVPGMSQTRLVQIERDILSKNDALARRNRAALAAHGVFALNLVSSPGSGKTTLLVRTIERLAGRLPVAVIEGDQQTSFDADRIRATGAPALQINTGKGCHLDAAMIETALARMHPAPDSVLMIENVGNLVCPAGFDLGEAHKVVVLSVTEGEDKPLKYPDMFHAASLLVLNKIDLLPHLQFDVERCLAHARQVNPGIEVIQLSATTGAGMDTWLAWIERGAQAARRPRA
jgi:hydrogenase nickel incorporation protein HypB